MASTLSDEGHSMAARRLGRRARHSGSGAHAELDKIVEREADAPQPSVTIDSA